VVEFRVVEAASVAAARFSRATCILVADPTYQDSLSTQEVLVELAVVQRSESPRGRTLGCFVCHAEQLADRPH
jgi:hypothetical protein